MKYTSVEQLRDKLREVSDFARDNELEFAIIFKADPITGGAEHRLIFSDNMTECRIWLDENIEKLNNMGIPYSAHITCGFYNCRGDIFAHPPINQ